MHAVQLLPIAGVVFLGVATPGPSFALVTSTAMSVSRRAGLLTALGFAAASCTWSLLAIAGLGIVMARSPWLHNAVRVAGAAYLIWLGLKMLLGVRKPVAAGNAETASGMAAVRRAYLVSMTNPKLIAFYTGIFSVMVPVSAPAWFYVAVPLMAAAINGVWYCAVAVMFSRGSVRRVFARAKTWIETTMGIVLIGSGGKIIFDR